VVSELSRGRSPIVKISEFQEVHKRYSILLKRSIIRWYEDPQPINQSPARNRALSAVRSSDSGNKHANCQRIP
jgi:hypothetical protein